MSIIDFFGGGVEDFGRIPAAAGATIVPNRKPNISGDTSSIFAQTGYNGGFFGGAKDILTEVLSFKLIQEQIERQNNQQRGVVQNTSVARSSSVGGFSFNPLWLVAGVLTTIGVIGLVVK